MKAKKAAKSKKVTKKDLKKLEGERGYIPWRTT